MILDIEGASASWADNKLYVAFDVVPEGRFHLALKTGEAFQSNSYAAFRKEGDKTISATLFVARRDHDAIGAELPSEMRYVPGRGERDSEIHLILRFPDNYLAGFHALILAGRVPRTVAILLQHGELEFDWEPDGSGQKWDNEKNPSIPIENVSFNFDFHPPSANQPLNAAVPEGDDRAFFSDVARVNFALLHKLSSIDASLGRLYRAVGLIVILVFGLALSRFWH